jgi:L-ascorbate metabolism protein UlaG (beta-lactamase superfamily)
MTDHPKPSHLRWRRFTDWAKKRDSAMRLADVLGRGRGRLRWFDHYNVPPAAPIRPDLTNWEKHDLAAVWLGHATVLLRIGGKTIITDPVMSHKVGVGLVVMTGGPRRHFASALDVSELPPLDLILISHAHFDHLDRPTLTRLPKATPVVTAANTSDLLRDLGFRHIREIGWGESTQLGPLKITGQRVAHWGARTFIDKHRGYNAYVIESGRRRVLYGGDTAYQDEFRGIGADGGVDLAILGIGAYDPFIKAHANPEQVWEMADHARARRILPMHHSTFRLSHEPMNEPLHRLMDAAGRDTDRIVIKQIGGSWVGD